MSQDQSDDQEVSLLITKSLRHELNAEESLRVSNHLKENEEAAKFAELSQLIQQSVAGTLKADTTADTTQGTGLSEAAKKRLKQSVNLANDEKLSLSQAGLLSNATAQEANQVIPTTSADNQQRRLVSKFKLIRRLGQGGLGNVWLARDEKLNRNVAIKELRPEALNSPQSWQRFHREAEITGHLEHPNVVPLYQYGVDQSSGEPFYAMRFVGKRTLSNAIEEYHDRIESGEVEPLCLHRLLSIFLDICQAIAYAHSRGVIHRDLKPENVALDNFGQVIVLDWGLAKVLEDSELGSKMVTNSLDPTDQTLAQTMHGDIVGTPLYMSPEQAAGALDKVDNRTDIYGLGAILFAILAGEAPHSKSSAKQNHSNVESVLRAISQAKTPQPSESRIGIPSALNTICVKAMSRKQHMRYSSVQELADAVESWMAGQNGKQSAYETLRMEGRELRADMQAAVFNLERNVRFASTLPPINALIDSKTKEDIAIWRERLATIFEGMIRANTDYLGIAYCSVIPEDESDGQQFREIVRVERHSRDPGTIRRVPKSKLRSDAISPYLTRLLNKKPDETHTALSCEKVCENSEYGSEVVELLCGVPVYDPQTEDVYGFVIINCDMRQMLRSQLDRRIAASEIVVSCDIFHTLLHQRAGQLLDASTNQNVADVAPHFSEAIAALQTNPEFIDEANADVYGARLWFTHAEHGIMYLLKR